MVLNQVFQFTHLLQKESTPEKLSLEDWASSKVRGARMPLNLWLTARGPFLALWNVRFDLPFHNMILIYKAVWSPWQKKKQGWSVIQHWYTFFPNLQNQMSQEESFQLPLKGRMQQRRVQMRTLQTGKYANLHPGNFHRFSQRISQSSKSSFISCYLQPGWPVVKAQVSLNETLAFPETKQRMPPP